jgi:hypothetical protein
MDLSRNGDAFLIFFFAGSRADSKNCLQAARISRSSGIFLSNGIFSSALEMDTVCFDLRFWAVRGYGCVSGRAETEIWKQKEKSEAIRVRPLHFAGLRWRTKTKI